MTQFFLGADVGGTKTHVIITDELGNLKGFSEGGPGNHEAVGYEGFATNISEVVKLALNSAGLQPDQITGSGLGIAGYDWPSQRPQMQTVVDTLHLGGAIELVNDCELGLLVGSPRGWGVTVVSGTGCNCCGWDEGRSHFGRITGGGIACGEFAGAGELMFMTARALAYDWTGRGEHTSLSKAFVEKYGTKDLAGLLESFMTGRVMLNPADARLVFQVAAGGDTVALDLIRWAGRELGELAKTVIRQLHFEEVDFDLVLIGSMFDGSPVLISSMKEVVLPFAKKSHFIRAEEPPVIGALLLGMEATGIKLEIDKRTELILKLGASISTSKKD